MFALLVPIFVIISALLVIVVLMQSGKGGGLSGAFGGGGNQTVFGGRGAVDFLGKATWVLGSAYMVLALVLAIVSASNTGPRSLIEKSSTPAPTPPPSAPVSGETPAGSGVLPGEVDLSDPAGGDAGVGDSPAVTPPAGTSTDTPSGDAPAGTTTEEPTGTGGN